MIRLSNIKLPLDHTEQDLANALISTLEITAEQLIAFNVFRRGIDARNKKKIMLMYTVDISTEIDDELLVKLKDLQSLKPTPDMTYKFVAKAPENLTDRPVVVGFGPCGLFIGLVLAQMGYRPIILDRGKEVRERTKDTFGFWRKKELNTESNVQFGAGGAGTYSDGKLYTQVKDPHFHSRKVLTEFVEAGAPEEILFISKPHIGTFKLVTMVETMRASAADAPERAIAFQGAPGANSHRAAMEAMPEALPLPCFDFADALESVKAGKAGCAIIPIENSQHGRVADIHFLLPESGLSLVGAYFMPIEHAFLCYTAPFCHRLR